MGYTQSGNPGEAIFWYFGDCMLAQASSLSTERERSSEPIDMTIENGLAAFDK